MTMTMHYDPKLVALSVLVAIFASYTALDLSSSVAHAKGRARMIWLAAGATAMGIGIWSMHFIGMLSSSMPEVSMEYDSALMALSVLIAIAASALALYVVSFHRVATSTFILAGLTMGLAIAGMHYTGMASMEMIGNLLDAQRISAHQTLPLQPESVDLAELTRETIQGQQFVYGDRFILKSPPVLVGKWDIGYLRRLIENLSSNAIKYGYRGEPVTIALEDLGNDVEIRVHNAGDPILPEDQKNLFRLFQRAVSAQKSGSVGWGIGLTLVKGVAEAHGGSIRLISVEGEGTTFVARLPKFASVVG